jgi:hypothetical protein
MGFTGFIVSASSLLLALLLTSQSLADVVIKSGSDSTTAKVEVNTNSLRVSTRPIDVLGSYALSGVTGAIAAGMAAGSSIFQFRWTGASNLAVVHRVSMGAASGATGFAAGTATCSLAFARSYTVTGTTGSVSILTTGSEGKKRTSFATSGVASGDLRISNTAASTGQTWTLDAGNMTTVGPFAVGTAVQTNFIPPNTVLFDVDNPHQWPLILAQNEGFTVRCTVPATGVWSANVAIEWSEVSTF